MLVVVVILFVLSWLPLYAIVARFKFSKERSEWEDELLNAAMPLAQWLGASNSCINPILYAFFNNKYRRGFAAIIKSKSCCGTLRYGHVIFSTNKVIISQGGTIMWVSISRSDAHHTLNKFLEIISSEMLIAHLISLLIAGTMRLWFEPTPRRPASASPPTTSPTITPPLVVSWAKTPTSLTSPTTLESECSPAETLLA